MLITNLLVFATKQTGKSWVRLFSERIQAIVSFARLLMDAKPTLYRSGGPTTAISKTLQESKNNVPWASGKTLPEQQPFYYKL